MANFRDAFPILMDLEGWDKQTDRKEDAGGTTRFGVSLRYMRSADMDLNGDGVVDAKDVALVDLEKAKAIALTEFWDYDGLESQKLANRMLSFSFVAGNGKANLTLQQVLSEATLVKCDGILGPRTLAAANQVPQDWLFDAYGKAMADHFWRCTMNTVTANQDEWPDVAMAYAFDVVNGRRLDLVSNAIRMLHRDGVENVGNLANIKGWMNRIERC